MDWGSVFCPSPHPPSWLLKISSRAGKKKLVSFWLKLVHVFLPVSEFPGVAGDAFLRKCLKNLTWYHFVGSKLNTILHVTSQPLNWFIFLFVWNFLSYHCCSLHWKAKVHCSGSHFSSSRWDIRLGRLIICMRIQFHWIFCSLGSGSLVVIILCSTTGLKEVRGESRAGRGGVGAVFGMGLKSTLFFENNVE